MAAITLHVFTRQSLSAHRTHQLQSNFSTKGLMYMCCSVISHHCECSHTSTLKHKSRMSNLQSLQATWTKNVSTQCSGMTYNQSILPLPILFPDSASQFHQLPITQAPNWIYRMHSPKGLLPSPLAFLFLTRLEINAFKRPWLLS